MFNQNVDLVMKRKYRDYIKFFVKKQLKNRPEVLWYARWFLYIFRSLISGVASLVYSIVKTISPELLKYISGCNPNNVYLELARLKQHRAEKLLFDSIELCKKAQSNAPNSFDTNAGLATAYLARSQPVEAWGYAVKALKIKPQEKWLWEFLFHIKAKSYGLLPPLLHTYECGRTDYPEVDFFREDGFYKKQEDAIKRGLPSILINTQAKSGTIYVRGKISQALRVPWCRLTVNPVDNEPIKSWVSSFARGGAVTGEHLFATDTTVNRLKECGIRKIVIHTRDPRDAAFSMLHFRKKQSTHASLINSTIGDHYGDATLDDSFLLECGKFIPYWLGWLNSWIKLDNEENSPFSLLFTDYREFQTDELIFFRKILEFYEIETEKFDFGVALADSHKAHFRSGKSGEWRTLVSENITEQVWKLMDMKLCKRFGWVK